MCLLLIAESEMRAFWVCLADNAKVRKVDRDQNSELRSSKNSKFL